MHKKRTTEEWCRCEALFEQRVQNGTRARRRQADVPFFGRSMVEVLGVLAIIGVLSVGAISGYSNAMMKYKTNKLVSEYNYLISGVLEYYNDFINLSRGTSLNPHLEKLNLIPQSFDKNGSYFVDVMGGNLNVWKDSSGIVVEIYFSRPTSQNFGIESCKALFQNLFYPLHSTLRSVGIWRGSAGSEGEDTSYPYTYYGDNQCVGNKQCLKNVKISDIFNACEDISENGQTYSLVASF